MQLTHLVINGFKSFADKTEIDFVPGLTGIVGPNGSGKSNITEAIRWTLGEQSAKSLRGEKMGDVIFAGTATRPPLNRAEVLMTFDNSDGYLKEQPATVTVCRRLYRDGESEFLINNQQVRLKDIVDLFMDSGLGKESFSFISQGRVEAIFNSKPQDRRGILEEAAGVFKYKQQKLKAEHELQTTDDNLARVSDIVSELQRQVAPLAEQASLARDYERLSGDYHASHQALLALEIAQLAAERSQTDADATITKQTVTALTSKIAHLEDRSEKLTAADQTYEAQLTALNDAILSASMKLESLTGEANLSAERATNAEATLSDLREREQAARDQLAAAAEKIKELTAHQTENDQAAKQVAAQLDAQTQAAATPAQLQAQLESARADYIDLLQQQARAANDVASIQKDQQLAENQNAAATARLNDLRTQLAAQQAQVNALTAQNTADRDAKKQAQAALAAAENQAASLQRDYADISDRYQKGYSLFQRAKSRYETLQELKEDYAGFFAGVRVVLKQKATLTGVIGAVAELVTVPAAYQQALDIALGANLQAIITEDETAAKNAIAYLKKTRSGRATFLPLSVIRPRPLPANVQQALVGRNGFIGVAKDLVSYDPRLENVMANLMGSLVVAQDMDAAIALANVSGHRYRIVTLEGDLINPGGSMTGGQVKQTGSSPLARNQEVTELKAQLRQMVDALKAQQQKQKEAHEALGTAQQQRQALQEAASDAAAKVEGSDAQLAAQQSQLTQLDRQTQATALSADGGQDLAGRLAAAQEASAQADAAVKAGDQLIETLKAQVAAASSSAADQQAALTQLKTRAALLASDHKTTAQQLAQWQENRVQAKQTVDQLTARIAAITKGATQSAQDKEDRQKTISDLKASLATMKANQDDLTKTKAANRGELSQVSAQITTAYTQQHTALTEQEQQSVSLNRIKINIDNRLTTLAEDYQLTYEAALADTKLTPADLPTLRSQLKLLKRGIDDLGPVNPNAITEYDNVKTRFDFLVKQQGDLNLAKDQLLATMGELDEEVKGRFKEIFDKTNAAFKEIFPKMFGGGHAHLSLTDPDDLLNTGIEIAAEPPGKKLSRLSLLSGGERALTAIVLLFAILQVRPVPFSILDEVEASLDEVNVNRFGEFLRHYASDTQFIVITHRRGTMLAANMLYGVTMQESGVSKMVAVSLDQVNHEEAQ
ncbi:chromosome segregation protein SMC [Lacticaseibacillus mingshuiensis]|uniref:Chromosome partition protein Smc n=1 Tax=Lacticaseibacillus mingshuiensis TaxID=2799574 RepID=A0ABW4CII3_9LACO|nr:chromosome segregation protein SMC [Lacticaseibacillus mingshuiensis]